MSTVIDNKFLKIQKEVSVLQEAALLCYRHCYKLLLCPVEGGAFVVLTGRCALDLLGSPPPPPALHKARPPHTYEAFAPSNLPRTSSRFSKAEHPALP